MANLQEIFTSECTLYNSLADLLETLYDAWEEDINFSFSKQELLEEFDYYIQCFLLKIALADRNFNKYEYQYIKKIVRYHDYLDLDYNNTEFDYETRKRLQEWAKKGLNIVPTFAILFDALEQVNPKGGNESWPKILINSLEELAVGLMQMDNDVKDEEIEDTILAYQSIFDFYIEKGYVLTNEN